MVVGQESQQLSTEPATSARLVLHDGVIVASNAGAQSLLDCPREELLGRPVLTFAAPEQAGGVPAADLLRERSTLALGQEPQAFEWLAQRPSGETMTTMATLNPMMRRGRIFLELVLAPVAADEEQPWPEVDQAVVGAPADGEVLEEPEADDAPLAVEAEPEAPAEEAETALTDGQGLALRLAMEHTAEAVFMTDVDGVITYVNSAFERMYGYGRDEAIGQTPRILKSGEWPEEYEVLWQRLLEGEVVSFEIVNQTADGRLIHVEGTNSPVVDEQGELAGFMGIHRDVSEQKQVEQALQAASQDLEQQVVHRTAELTQANALLVERGAEMEQLRRQLRQRNEVMQALSELSHRMAADPDTMAPFEEVIGRLAGMMDATSAHLYELEPESGVSVIAEYLSPSAGPAESLLGSAADDDLLNDVVASRQRFITEGRPFVRHAGDRRLSSGEREGMARRGVNSILGIPLPPVGGLMAVLEFWDSREKRPFNRDEIMLAEAVADQLVVPLDNARLLSQIEAELAERRQTEDRIQESLERRSRQVQLSAQVARDVVTAANLDELYRRVVTQVKEQFGHYHVQLLRYEEAADAVALIAGYGEVGRQMKASGHRMPLGIGLIGKAAQTGQSVLRPDVGLADDWQPNPLLPETKAELAVPIMLGESVLGVLDVQSSRVNGLDEEDQLVLEGLCGQIAVAIESTRLRQEMADRLDELNRLQQIMSHEGWLSFRARRDTGALGYRFSLSALEDVDSEQLAADRLWPDDQKAGQETLAKPMRVRGEVIGTLGIEDDPEHPMSPEDQELLEAISVQVAEALESARLLEQTQRHAVEMEAVAQVSAAASTILEAPKLLQTVASLTRERFDLQHVGIYVLEDGRLTKASESPQQPVPRGDGQLPEIAMDNGRSAVARAASDGTAMLVHDLQASDDFLVDPSLAEARSELAIPLVVGGQVLGVLDLLSTRAHRFGDDDVRIHTTLAAQVAVAYQNANLYARQLETTARLREVDRLKSQFLASMSHELRTPLNSIIGFADVLLEGIDGPLNDRMREDVTLIRDSGRHLRALIGEMLDMSKIEAGMMELRYEVINIPLLAREVMANTRSLALGKDLDIVLDLDERLATVQADRTRLTQILLNLLSNAVKFTKRGSVTLAMTDRDENMLVQVSDTGIGIKAADIPTIFEQFRQIDGSMTRQAGGTGLGLSISKSLVELHGGQMWVESAPGKGSTFYFTIPKEQPSGEQTRGRRSRQDDE
jgi:PAS domain S-box-containing protein